MNRIDSNATPSIISRDFFIAVASSISVLPSANIFERVILESRAYNSRSHSETSVRDKASPPPETLIPSRSTNPANKLRIRTILGRLRPLSSAQALHHHSLVSPHSPHRASTTMTTLRSLETVPGGSTTPTMSRTMHFKHHLLERIYRILFNLFQSVSFACW